MADIKKADELNSKIQSLTQRFKSEITNVGSLDFNVTAIRTLIEKAAASGILSAYRPINATERAELSKNESDEIANAYYAKLDGKEYYITYKSRVSTSKDNKSVLEHVNRSTAFVEALLTKISAEFSFLYCKSRVQKIKELPAPHCKSGFTCIDNRIDKKDSSNKYEIFFLIECMDNIDPAERLANIIDSVLLDVDTDSLSSGDFFNKMSYTRLERDESQDESHIRDVDPQVRTQLTDIITSIRDKAAVRSRIVDYLAQEKNSELNSYFAKRNEVFNVNRNEKNITASETNSTITCRLMPIGVFLNEIENYLVTYTLKDKFNRTVHSSFIINPTSNFTGHSCPKCGTMVDEGNGLLIADSLQGAIVACESCSKTCAHSSCGKYVYNEYKCDVCSKAYCNAHLSNCGDEGNGVCSSCGDVFYDSASKKPISPYSAAIVGKSENYIINIVSEKGEKSLPIFKKETLRKKSDCEKCLTQNEKKETVYGYFLKSDIAKCDNCNESFAKKDLKISKDDNMTLCFLHRADCSCGNVVHISKSEKCSVEGCTHAFCKSCMPVDLTNSDYSKALKHTSDEKIKKVTLNSRLYCSKHVHICRCCGKIVESENTAECGVCLKPVCKACLKGNICPTCSSVEKLSVENYKTFSSPTRPVRLNSVSIFDKLSKKIGVVEDKEAVYYVYFQENGTKKTVIYDKFTHKFNKG